MTTHKVFALLCCLLYFCFLSTSYAQPCSVETNLTNDAYYQIPIDDHPEPNPLLSTSIYIKSLPYLNPLIEKSVLKSRQSYILPCCNRDPPLYYFIQ